MRLALSLAAMSLTAVRADLPIHCLNSDVTGRWELELTEGHHNKADACGYRAPDQNEYHFGAKVATAEAKFEKAATTKVMVDLVQPNQLVQDGRTAGTWTMVYDEGFELTYNGGKYFAFNKYTPKEGTQLTSYEVKEYTSICSETRIGWYRTEDGAYGCWRGRQVQADAMMELNHDTARKHKNRIDRLRPKKSVPLPFEQDRPLVSLIDTSATDLLPFHPDLALIDSINNDPASTWKAAVPKSFTGKTLGDIRMYLGRRKFAKPSMRVGLLQETITEKAQSTSKQKLVDVDGNDFPEEFSWREKMSSPADQGPCGSCYTVSSMAAYEARYRIAHDGDSSYDTLKFSPQDVLSCSDQNQGCEGGYPYLVAKFGEEEGYVSSDEMAYKASDSPKCNRSPEEQRYFIKNHHYVGGYYGSCTEQAMMLELKQNGPMVLGFEAPDSLSYYQSGVFKGPSPDSEEQKTGGDHVHKWQHTNHAVTLVGWGVEKVDADGKPLAIPEPYWLIQNTWGPDWGEGGYFKMARGTNECAIESMAVAADVV